METKSSGVSQTRLIKKMLALIDHIKKLPNKPRVTDKNTTESDRPTQTNTNSVRWKAPVHSRQT